MKSALDNIGYHEGREQNEDRPRYSLGVVSSGQWSENGVKLEDYERKAIDSAVLVTYGGESFEDGEFLELNTRVGRYLIDLIDTDNYTVINDIYGDEDYYDNRGENTRLHTSTAELSGYIARTKENLGRNNGLADGAVPVSGMAVGESPSGTDSDRQGVRDRSSEDSRDRFVRILEDEAYQRALTRGGEDPGEGFIATKAKQKGYRLDRTGKYYRKEGAPKKSAANVTYDDNGDVIPPSARFNENSADPRYALNDTEYLELAKNPMLNEILRLVIILFCILM